MIWWRTRGEQVAANEKLRFIVEKHLRALRYTVFIMIGVRFMAVATLRALCEVGVRGTGNYFWRCDLMRLNYENVNSALCPIQRGNESDLPC